MRTHAFALAIVNDLFDEDLDPDLFLDAAEEASMGLAADARARPLDAPDQGTAAWPALVAPASASRRLV